MAPVSKRRRPASARPHKICQHERLTTLPSAHALSSGHQEYTKTQVYSAWTRKRKLPRSGDATYLNEFPSALGLPGDEIVCDPQYPPQSVQSWSSEPNRNPVTRKRNVIYVAAPPTIDASAIFMKRWSRPMLNGKQLSVLWISRQTRLPDADCHRNRPANALSISIQSLLI